MRNKNIGRQYRSNRNNNSNNDTSDNKNSNNGYHSHTYGSKPKTKPKPKPKISKPSKQVPIPGPDTNPTPTKLGTVPGPNNTNANANANKSIIINKEELTALVAGDHVEITTKHNQIIDGIVYCSIPPLCIIHHYNPERTKNVYVVALHEIRYDNDNIQ